MTGPTGSWKSRGVDTTKTENVVHLLNDKIAALELHGLGAGTLSKMFGGTSGSGPRAIKVADHCVNNAEVDADVINVIGKSLFEAVLKYAEVAKKVFVVLEGNFAGKELAKRERDDARKKAFADGKYVASMSLTDCMIEAMMNCLDGSEDPLVDKIEVIDPQVGEGEAQCMDLLRVGAADIVCLPSKDFDVMMYEPGTKGSLVLLGCKINAFLGPPSISAAVADVRKLRASIVFPATAKSGGTGDYYDTRTWTTRHFIAVNVCVASDYARGIAGVGLKTAVKAMAAVLEEEDGSNTHTLEDLVRLCSNKCRASISKEAQDILVAAALCFWSHPVVRFPDGIPTVGPANPIPRFAFKGKWLEQTDLGKAFITQMKEKCGLNKGKAMTEKPYVHFGCSNCPNLQAESSDAKDFQVAGIDPSKWVTPVVPNGLPTLSGVVIEKWVGDNTASNNLPKKMDEAVNRAFYDVDMDKTFRLQVDNVNKKVHLKGSCIHRTGRQGEWFTSSSK